MTTKQKRRKVSLQGLPGVKKEFISAIGATSVTDAVKCLRTSRAITAAGDKGAVNVWRDDEGMLRCEFHQYRVVKDSQSFKHLAAVAQWLKQWWPEMGR